MSASALRGLEVLTFLAHRSRPATINDVAVGIGMSRATAYRIVDDLVKAGWLSLMEPGSRLRQFRR